MSSSGAAETDTQADAVANTSGVTIESLQRTLTEKLEAKHVDIEDMSGEREREDHSAHPPKKRQRRGAFADVDLFLFRRVWSVVSSHDRFAPVREEE